MSTIRLLVSGLHGTASAGLRGRSVLASLWVVGVLAASAPAATYYWDNNSGGGWGTNSGNWSDTAWTTSNTGNGTLTTWPVDAGPHTAQFQAPSTGAITVDMAVTNINHLAASSGVGSNTVTLSGGTLTFAATANITASTSGTGGVTVDSLVAGAGTSLTKLGTGTLRLNAANTYAGSTLISSGVLQTTNVADGGSPSGIGQSSNAAANLVINSGFVYVGGPAGATDRSFTLNGTGTGTIGVLAGAGNLTIFGGSAANTGNLSVNTYSTTSGTLILAGANQHTGSTTVVRGVLQLGNGGTTGTLSPSGTVSVVAPANFTIDRSNAVTQGSDFSSAAITGNGSFTQAGSGTTTFNVANTYSGQTNVLGGALALVGSGSIGNSAAIVVGSGATLDVSSVGGGWTLGASQALSGTGTVLGNATIAGSLAPGNSPGVLTFSDDLLMTSTTATTMEILGLVRGDDYDGIDVGATLDYGGSLTLDLGTTFGVGSYTFNLFDFDNASGAFDAVAIVGEYAASMTNDSGVWSASTNAGQETWTFTQGTGVLNLVVVPEPGTVMLAVGGGLGILAVVRARRRQA